MYRMFQKSVPKFESQFYEQCTSQWQKCKLFEILDTRTNHLVPAVLAFINRNRLMTTGYFAKSVSRETCVLYNFMVSDLSDLLVNPWSDVWHITKLFLPVKARHRNLDTNWKHRVMWKRECHRPNDKSPKRTWKQHVGGYFMTEILWISRFEENRVWKITYCHLCIRS